MAGGLLWVWRASRGYHFTPWKSPYLRWRMETYWGLHAEKIGFSEFWRFAWQRRADLIRFLKWASAMDSATMRRS